MEMNKSERSPDMQKVTLETPDRKTPQNMLGSCFDQLFQYSPVVGRYICPLGLSKNWKNRSSGLTFIISISWDFLILRIRFPRRGALENSILSSAESLLRRSSLYKLHEDVLSFNLQHRETASGLPGKTYYFFLIKSTRSRGDVCSASASLWPGNTEKHSHLHVRIHSKSSSSNLVVLEIFQILIKKIRWFLNPVLKSKRKEKSNNVISDSQYSYFT